MPQVSRCERGPAVLLRLLATRLHDLRDQTPESFARWLERHLRGWSVDPVFQQRVRVREIRRANPVLQQLERERGIARAAYEASPDYRTLEQRRRELSGGENAVSGLEHAIGKAADEEERVRLAEKLTSYRRMVADLSLELERLRSTSVEWQALHEVAERLGRERAATNFDREIARLSELQRDHGRSSGRSGAAFEQAAADVVRSEILPELERNPSAPELVILRGVRLGSARAEFDHVIVRERENPDDPVEVVAAVEAKRNPNDLAHGLRHRVDNLFWFAGREGDYDPDSYRTTAFPTGHFDRPAIHVEKDGRRYAFTRESFAVFAEELPEPDGGVGLPRRLYLVSRPGWLWGISSGGLGRIAHRVSSDVDFDLGDSSYLASLLEWSKRLTHAVETPDLLRHFAANADDASRILLLSPD